MNFTVLFCILFSGISMIMDIKWEKVYNYWIFTGFLCRIFRFLMEGEKANSFQMLSGMCLPLLLLFPLFLCKMLGTGDIKVFAVLGSAMGGKKILSCMALSFLIGAFLAVPILLFRCDAKKRFLYFFSYLNHVMTTKSFPPYLAPGKHPENIHFTIPIFISVLLLCLQGGMI